MLGEVDCGVVLLMDNAHYPWLVLVPFTEWTELHELDPARREEVCRMIDRLSRFVTENFPVDKINIGAIGNIVAQLHIHIVGRRHDDPCWPGVVWGSAARIPCQAAQVVRMREMLRAELGGEWREVPPPVGAAESGS